MLFNKLKIERIDRDKRDEQVIAYSPVAEEKFYFAIYFDINAREVT
jgi:hypothetical protein